VVYILCCHGLLSGTFTEVDYRRHSNFFSKANSSIETTQSPTMSTDSSSANSTQTFVPCTIDTCPLSEGVITYQPSIAGNSFFVALFGILLLVQLGLGIRHQTWSYLVAMAFGLILEVVGYVGRVQLHDDPFDFNFFIEYAKIMPVPIRK